MTTPATAASTTGADPRPGAPATGVTAGSAKLVLIAFLVTRAIILGALLVVVRTKNRTVHDAISAWDVQHFEAIATVGYANPIDRAFFPGLPLLLRLGHAVGLPMGGFGMVIGLVCSALAAWALYRMGGALAACWWLAAPVAVFTTVGYTEAPFCAAAFWAWERARARDWTSAALLAALACSFRISGLFLVGALGLLALSQAGVTLRRRALNCLLAASPVLVIVAYFAYLHSLTGSWTAWLDAQQQGWARGFTNPLDALGNTLDAARASAWPDRPEVATVFAFEVVSMAVGLLVTVACLLKRRWAEAGWVGVQVFAFATSWWFMSVNRAVLLWFPLYLLLAELSRHTPRNPGNRVVWQGAAVLGWLGCVASMAWWAWLYFTGAWAS